MGGVTSPSPATFYPAHPLQPEQMSNKHAVFVPSCCRLALWDWLNLSCLLGWPEWGGMGWGILPCQDSGG